MSPFDYLACGFLAVAFLNIFLLRKRGLRAAGIGLAAIICSVAAYLWERDDSSAPKWLLAAAGGVFLATVFYESGKRRIEPK